MDYSVFDCRMEQFVRRSMYVQRFDCLHYSSLCLAVDDASSGYVHSRLSTIGMYLRSLLFRAFVSGVFVRLDLFVYLANRKKFLYVL